MTEGVTRRGWLRPGSPLRTSQGAAIAGIIFGVFLITALVLLRVSVPAHPEAAGTWLADSRRRTAVAVAVVALAVGLPGRTVSSSSSRRRPNPLPIRLFSSRAGTAIDHP